MTDGVPRISIAELIVMARSSAWTAIFVNRAGEITELIPMTSIPTTEEMIKIAESHYGTMFKFLPAGSYSEADIQKEIAALVDGYDLFEGPLRPGVKYY